MDIIETNRYSSSFYSVGLKKIWPTWTKHEHHWITSSPVLQIMFTALHWQILFFKQCLHGQKKTVQVQNEVFQLLGPMLIADSGHVSDIRKGPDLGQPAKWIGFPSVESSGEMPLKEIEQTWGPLAGPSRFLTYTDLVRLIRIYWLLSNPY